MPEIARKNPWRFIPTLYFVEGLPNALITGISIVFFKHLGMSEAQITVWAALLGAPWALKPLWTPLVDLVRTKKEWICLMQLCVAAAVFGIAAALKLNAASALLIFLFLALTFFSATYDAAVDGYYIDALNERDQAFFSGIRNTFFRIGSVIGKGGLISLAGFLSSESSPWLLSFESAWALTLSGIAGLYIILCLYHARFALQTFAPNQQHFKTKSEFYAAFFNAFLIFFKKKNILTLLAFVFLYRFAESQLSVMPYLFITASHADGGLGMSDTAFGILTLYGSVAMLAGGIFGGWLMTRFGIGKLFWPMAFAINIPDILYLILAVFQIDNFSLTALFMCIEQFGYGFGFTSFMLVLIWFVEDSLHYRTSHYAICSALMVGSGQLLGAIPGFIKQGYDGSSTLLQTLFPGLSYTGFFIWILVCTIPSFLGAWLISKCVPATFGKKR